MLCRGCLCLNMDWVSFSPPLLSLSPPPLSRPSQSHYHGPTHGRLHEVEEASEAIAQANEVIEQRRGEHMKRQVGVAGTHTPAAMDG